MGRERRELAATVVSTFSTAASGGGAWPDGDPANRSVALAWVRARAARR